MYHTFYLLKNLLSPNIELKKAWVLILIFLKIAPKGHKRNIQLLEYCPIAVYFNSDESENIFCKKL